MPIYMDRHHIEDATHDSVLEAHQKDLELQDKYQTRFLTYWFDRDRGSVFCLVDAPDQEALIRVHDEAHGDIPHDIIEVNLNDVETFLGRTTDPKPDEGKEQPTFDSAFRCIMFTDLKDSSSMSRLIGDNAAIELLDAHDRIIRGMLSTYHGKEIKHTGDGFLASFKDVVRAVQCSVGIQQAFQRFNNYDPPFPLQVRVGINAGEPVERNNDLFGITVNLASRVCDHCTADHILISGIVQTLYEREKSDLTFIDAGKTLLKGFEHAIQLYEVDWSTL